MASTDIASYVGTEKSVHGDQTTQQDYIQDVPSATSADLQTDSCAKSHIQSPISSTEPATHSHPFDQPSDFPKQDNKSDDSCHETEDLNLDKSVCTQPSEGSSRDSELNISNMPNISNALPRGTDCSNFVVYHPTKNASHWEDRLAKTPPPWESKWMIPASWPPSESAQTSKGYQSEFLPSKDAPLHVQIQAYALRWGYWASKIEDKERREEVLKSVTDKMRNAWEMAIKEGYYRNSGNSTNASNGGDVASPANSKKGRKRALSLSRQAAGLTSEGKDPFAVTVGELQHNNITMDMIKERIENRDLVDAELLMDRVLTSLDRNIQIKDWSVSMFMPQVRGRNLLMYCLYVVQQSRSEIEKLRWLHGKFVRDSQKRTTQGRIDNHRERVDQHLALAAELNMRQGDGAIESEETTSVAPESFHGKVQQKAEIDHDFRGEHVDTDAVPVQGSPSIPVQKGEDVLIGLAKAVLFARDLNTLSASFTSYGLSMDDLKTDTGIAVGNDETLLLVKHVLGDIFGQILWVRSIQKDFPQHHDPNDNIIIRHAAQLAQQRIAESLQQLQTVLDQARPSEQEQNATRELVSFVDREKPQAPDKIPYTISAAGGEEILLGSGLSNGAKRCRPDDNEHLNPSGNKKLKTIVVTKTTVDDSQVSPNIQLAADMESSILKSNSTNRSERECSEIASSLDSNPHNESQKAAKQAYIREIWLPTVNKMLIQGGQAPYQGSLSTWKAIKEVLANLGYGHDMRNAYLRQFKKGFEKWCDDHKLKTSGANAAPTTELPRKDQSTQRWPIDTSSSRNSSFNNYNEDKTSTSNNEAAIDKTHVQSPVTGKMALNKSCHRLVVKLKLADSQDFGEYKSHLLNEAPKQGFSFRFLPNATMEQRIRLDEHIYDYLRETFKQNRPYGRYIQFVDPEDPSGGEVAHGFWNRSDGSQPERSEWFYEGKKMPEDWKETEIVDDSDEDETNDVNIQATKKASKVASTRRKTDSSDRSTNAKRQSGTKSRSAGHISASTLLGKAQIGTRSTTAKKPQRSRRIVPEDDDGSDPDYDPSD